MKWHRGVVVCASIATLAITLIATVNLHGRTISFSTLPCLSCRNFSQESESRVLFSAKETNPAANLLEKGALNFITNAAILAQRDNGSTHGISPTSEGIRAPEDCVKRNCREHLSDSEKSELKVCERLVRTRDHYRGQINDSDCKFLPKAGRHPVALVSARGSGNTWTRGLLEKATGICTGFIFCDTVMRAHGYVGETVRSGKVLVVKTHSTVPKWRGESNDRVKPDNASYASAVLILRNPAKSAIAEWNRKSAEIFLGRHNFSIARGRHTYSVPRDLFEGHGWNKFLQIYMKDWSSRLHQWVIDQDRHPVHILRYEDLKQDTPGEIERTLDFLNVSYDFDSLKSKLSEDYSEFQRQHNGDDFEHYSVEQKELLRAVLLELKEAAERANKSHLLRLDEYLLSITS